MAYRFPIGSPLLGLPQLLDSWEKEGQFLLFGDAEAESVGVGAANDDPWSRPPPGRFGWDDGFAEMRVLVPVEDGLPACHVHVEISPTRLVVALDSVASAPLDGLHDGLQAAQEQRDYALLGAGEIHPSEACSPQVALDVELFASVDPSASWWQLEDRAWYYGSQRRCLVVTLSKLIRSPWLALEPLDGATTDGWWHSRSDAWQSSPARPPAAACSSTESRASESRRPTEAAAVGRHPQASSRAAAGRAHHEGGVVTKESAHREDGNAVQEDADSPQVYSSAAEEGPHLAFSSAHADSDVGVEEQPAQAQEVDEGPQGLGGIDAWQSLGGVFRQDEQRNRDDEQRAAREGESEEDEDEKAIGPVEAGDIQDLGSPAVTKWLEEDDGFQSNESEEELRNSCIEQGASGGRAAWPSTRIDWESIDLPSTAATSDSRKSPTAAEPLLKSASSSSSRATGAGASRRQGADGSEPLESLCGSAEGERAKLQAQMDEDWKVCSCFCPFHRLVLLFAVSCRRAATGLRTPVPCFDLASCSCSHVFVACVESERAPALNA